MQRLGVFLLSFLFVFGGTAAAARETRFAQNNPDIDKYEYARSFIAALTYIKAVHVRWQKPTPAKSLKGAKELIMMRGFFAYLIKDNADLRIAKNYLVPYLQSSNALIKKSADIFILSCNTVIAINDKEKQFWDQWNAVKANGLGTRKNETAFLNAQEALAMRRKEAFKGVISASVLLTKVLRSEQNKDENGNLLAISETQRHRLVKMLDEVGKGNLDWGLKAGQTFQEASVAVIREVLEDPLYQSAK